MRVIVCFVIPRYLGGMKKKLLSYFSEFGTFLKALGVYLSFRLGGAFFRFEFVKGLLVSVLYRRRGKYAQPFMHSAMAVFIFLGVTFGPLFIAQSFPGQAMSVEDALPSDVVLSTTGVEESSVLTLISEKPRAEVINYEVNSGDTVGNIASKFGVSIDAVLWANDMTENQRIKPGQKLKVPPVSGIVHSVRKGDTIYSIAKKYNAEAQAVVDFPFNTFTNDETFALAVGQVIIVPDGVKPNVRPVSPSSSFARVRTPDAGVVSATGNFAWPASGTVSQRYAWYHKGVDIANKAGGAILAADSGLVITAGWPDNRGYANRVIIDHQNGFVTLYAHMSSVSVRPGQRVNQGDMVGSMGCTGRCTGTHLHFEVRKNGVYLNALNFLR